MIDYHFFPLSESSLMLIYPNKIDVHENTFIQQLAQTLQHTTEISGITSVIPGYATLTVNFDLLQIDQATLRTQLTKQMHLLETTITSTQRIIDIPVCYDEEFGPDLQAVADFGHLTIADLIQLHTQQTYFIFMLGFLPGFAYMGSVPDQIAMPRLATPRKTLAAGSVGIAGQQTGFYPVVSPGGWRLLGRTPLKLYDPKRPQPRYHAGDYIHFYSVDRHDFDEIYQADRAGAFQLQIHQRIGDHS
ncbi:5-oxoprolinase subunit PxpB [Agrilactobacillus fermenti]|uniref:5-oxoprolinase subunit PxpB n=1 Tax=Agrilactobacillus fermenti TaxID=2586909 RepID=UPI003A5C582A